MSLLSIKLWKDYSTSTDEERDAYLRKFYLRFQKLKSGEINTNASVALNDYEVGANDTLMQVTCLNLLIGLDVCFLHQTCLLQRWCLETFGEVKAIESL